MKWSARRPIVCAVILRTDHASQNHAMEPVANPREAVFSVPCSLGSAWQTCAMRVSQSSRARDAKPSLYAAVARWRRRTFVGRRAAMRYLDKIVDRPTAIVRVEAARRSGKRIAFTNGCFDLMHVGHVRYLAAAREAGDLLIVAINDDASVRRLKGPDRPLTPEAARAEVLAALAAVDLVTTFSEDTPAEVIAAVLPDVLVKGADWALDQVVGREVVEARGGKVLLVPVVAGFSTTALVERLAKRP
jgi:D-glycero-beta-D-manno-heptose 1-phosphate adenylyltransferase